MFKSLADAIREAEARQTTLAAVALEAEKMNHHPDWTNSFNKVHIELVTHDAEGVTEKDILLARKIQHLAALLQK